MFTPVIGLAVLFFLGTTSQEETNTKFSCKGRAGGYYADVDSGCQIYHMCDGLGRQFSYSCPNTTLFQQRMLICDHWYMVNCSGSERDYTANLLIGQKKPFVDDSEKHPYHRTPRPDLLSQPTAAEFNIIYRTGKTQNHTDLNIVGLNSDYDQNNGSSRATDRPAYHLPSHWSTEYSKEDVTPPTAIDAQQVIQRNQVVTSRRTNTVQFSQSEHSATPTSLDVPKEIIQNKASVKLSVVNITPEIEHAEIQNNARIVTTTPTKRLIPIPRAINFNTNDLNNVLKYNPFPKKDAIVNFKSSFKATTPVFPTKDELVTTESPLHDILKPPGQDNHSSGLNNLLNGNFFPKNEVIVNFNSNFQATTPVFPTKDELVTTESPLHDILEPPGSDILSNGSDDNFSRNNPIPENEVIVNFRSNFQATTPVFPTKDELGTTESPLHDILKPPGTLNRSNDPNDLLKRNPIPKKEALVNFKSNFQATTPVFPTKDELVTTESPLDDILNPPDPNDREQSIFNNQPQTNIEFAPISLPTPSIEPPSIIFEPPNLESYYTPEDSATEENKYTVKTETIKGTRNKSKPPTRQSNDKMFKNLRKMFAIPDYEFALDVDSRPGYSESIDSFQVNPFFVDVVQRQHAS